MAQVAGAAVVTYDFSTGDQGFTATGTTGAGNAFSYDPINGEWRVNGVIAVGTSRLAAPVVVALGGVLTISFTHGWNFENNFDGGQLLVSLDGGAPQLVPEDAFTQTPYNSTISASFGSPIGGQRAWSGSSAPVVSTAVLGPLVAGTTAAFLWQGAWDSSVIAGNPNWRMASVTIDGIAEAPLPGTLALCLLGLGLLARRRST